MHTPSISILVPVHNAAETIVEAMDSMLAQTLTDWELVGVDDGSTDASVEIMRDYAQRDSRVRLISRERCGIVEALMTAAENARGRLLARMDADDIAAPTRLAAQAALFDAMPELVLCGTRVRMFGASIGSGRQRYECWVNSLIHHADIERELLVECPIPHPTFMLPREIFNAVGGYRDCGWPEDYDLVLRLRLFGGAFAKPDPVLLHWRHCPQRLSMNDERYSDKAFRALKRHFLQATCLHDTANRFYQWGAGEVGKRWLREWPQPPRAVVDINPRKIGRTIHGVPVIPPEQLPPPGQCIILIAVGTPGARDDIRDRLNPRNYRELEHYRFIA